MRIGGVETARGPEDLSLRASRETNAVAWWVGTFSFGLRLRGRPFSKPNAEERFRERIRGQKKHCCGHIGGENRRDSGPSPHLVRLALRSCQLVTMPGLCRSLVGCV
jgi:hypothetical protein